MNADTAMEYMQENDIKFIRLQFVDLLGRPKNIAIMASQLTKALQEGISFDASLISGFSGGEHTELLLLPRFDTVRLLPWRPQHGRVARILCDIVDAAGSGFAGDCRAVLRQVQKKAVDRGYDLRIGPECKFFLFHTDENGKPTTQPFDSAGYADVAPLDGGENIRREICLTLEELGLEVLSSHHEAASGQNEIEFKYSSALAAADDFMLFKTVVKTIAQRNGLHASFMPKPLSEAPGSGLHINVSLLQNGSNVFTAPDGMSDTARHFTAGILRYAREFAAVTNPLVNSYKRLASGEAPSVLSWSIRVRGALVRVLPSADGQIRLELRSPDPACNPYLAIALICEAGLAGIEQRLPLDQALEAGGDPGRLPRTLLGAIDAMKESAFTRTVLGDWIFENYCRLKVEEWEHYDRTVHDWEVDNYLSTC